VLLVAPSAPSPENELEIVYLGVHGVLPLSADIDTKLMPAIHSVAQNKLWMSNETVDELVRQARSLSGHLSVDDFTAREHQVVTLLLKSFSNKKIAETLSISERTTKFHVSNILRKANVGTRRDLMLKANYEGSSGSLSLSPSHSPTKTPMRNQENGLRAKAHGA
jgi:DNA-binding NarL/FixJ family response regulator